MKLDFELKRHEMQMQMHTQQKLAELQTQQKLAELDLQAKLSTEASNVNPNAGQSFRIESATKMIPKLTAEHEIETYLIMFEKTARMNSWPDDKWAAILQTQLKRKGLKVFAELTDSECQDFAKLKKSLLTAYELCPEVYRQKFRKLTKLSNETHSDFAFRHTTAFQRWLQSLNAYDNIEMLRQIFLMEQFSDMSPADLKLWLNDRQPKSLEQMARLADEYLALRKSFAVSTENYQVSNETVLLYARTQKHVPYKTLHFEKGNKRPHWVVVHLKPMNMLDKNLSHVSGVINQVTRYLNAGNVKDKKPIALI